VVDLITIISLISIDPNMRLEGTMATGLEGKKGAAFALLISRVDYLVVRDAIYFVILFNLLNQGGEIYNLIYTYTIVPSFI